MSELSRYVDERITGSITSPSTTNTPVDEIKPLTFTEWLQYNKFLYTSTEDFLVRYQSYLNNWFKTNNNTAEDSSSLVRLYYTNLIDEIVLNYTTIDERRYLQNLNFNDDRDMALAIPFFAKKLKDICLYFSTLRDNVQFGSVQYNLKGSKYGIDTTLFNSFIKSLNTDDLTADILTLKLSLSTIRNNTTIEVEDIYDTYSNYYDINPLAPASAYNSTNDLRAQFFTLNQYEVDPDLFLNTGFSIIRAIISYPFHLIELGENLRINPTVTTSDVRYLKDSNYTDLVTVSSARALNLSLKAQEISKYSGADFYYVQTDSTGTQFVSGLLFKAESDFANVLNKRFPSVIAVPSEEFLKTGKEIGLFYKPDKIGLSNFTNFKLIPNVDFSRLEPDTVYYFPDPYIYGNVTSNTQLTFDTPFKFTEISDFNKIDGSNSYRFGDVYNSSFLQTFRAYQSREQSTNTSNLGLAKYTDAQDFFTGDQKSIWANRDLYEFTDKYRFPLEKRINELLSLNKTLVQYKTDVYGNEYGVYKLVEPFTNKLIPPFLPGTGARPTIPGQGAGGGLDAAKICLLLNGYTFFDTASGYFFDYTTVDPDRGYSGVILKTTLTDPPTFAINQEIYNLESYIFQPDTFCEDLIKNEFSCIEFDGSSFIATNGSIPLDFPSDNPSYDPLNSALYYNVLVDAGLSPVAFDFRATFANPGDFTFMPPSTAVTELNGLYYLLNNEDPCAGSVQEFQPYVEPSNFADIRIALKRTSIDEEAILALATEIDDTLKSDISRLTIYNTRNLFYGESYFRNSNNSVIAPLSAGLSAIFIKYPENVQYEINSKLVNLDVYYDTIQIETENYIIFEQINFNYDTNLIVGGNAGINILYRGDNKVYEKYSTVWFNEQEKELLLCKTTLYNEYSASNYKIIFPKIFSYRLDTQRLIQIYPDSKDSDLTFNKLNQFTLSGKNIEVNIVEIDKPLLTFNDENNIYKLTYIGRDISNIFYIITTLFRYIDGKLTVITSTIYKLGSDVYCQNFANPDIGDVLQTYNMLGSAVGVVDTNTGTFNWGEVCTLL